MITINALWLIPITLLLIIVAISFWQSGLKTGEKFYTGRIRNRIDLSKKIKGLPHENVELHILNDENGHTIYNIVAWNNDIDNSWGDPQTMP